MSSPEQQPHEFRPEHPLTELASFTVGESESTATVSLPDREPIEIVDGDYDTEDEHDERLAYVGFTTGGEYVQVYIASALGTTVVDEVLVGGEQVYRSPTVH